MLKICHLRGEKNYWNNTKPTIKKWYKKLPMIPIWEELYNFNFLEYRKKIRKIIIQSIVNSKEYDIICYNDEDLQDTLKQIKDNETISFHSQDDDDIYLGCDVHNNKIPIGIYNAPNLAINWRNSMLSIDKKISATPYDFLSGMSRKKYITGSCNLIIVSPFSVVKDFLNFISLRSFNSRHCFNSFIFNWKDNPTYRKSRSLGISFNSDHNLKINTLKEPINIEFKHFFSFTYLQRLHKTVDIKSVKLKNIFEKEYKIINNCNILNVKYWDQFKIIYRDFYKKINI